MIISCAQELEIKNKIIQELIESGVEPTVKEINNRFSDYLLNKTIGYPYSEELEIIQHSQSNIDGWNNFIKSLSKDLNIIFKSIENLKENAFLKQELIKSSISKCQNEIQKLDIRLNAFKNILSSKDVYSFESYTFDNYSNSEFYGKKSINLPYTDSFIDLLNKQVTSNKTTSEDGIVDLSNSRISITSTSRNASLYTTGNPKSIISFYEKGFSVIQKVKEKKENGVLLKIKLPEPVLISTISMEVKSLTQTTATLYITDKENNSEKIYSESFFDNAEWNFSEKEISSLDIVFQKKNPDSIEEDFSYIYSIKNVLAFRDTYEKKSVYVSKPIAFKQVVDSVKVDIQDIISSETSINYYIGVDNDKDIIDWIPVENQKDTSLNLLSKKDDVFFQDQNKEFGYSVLGKLKDYYNANSLKILSGYQQWRVEVLSCEKFNKDYILNISDYNVSNIVENSVLDCDEYNLNISSQKMIVLTTTIFSDNRYDVDSKSIKSLSKDNTLQMKVFANNNEIIKNENEWYDFSLRKGKNKIIVVLYSSSEETEKIVFNFNFKNLSQNIGCGGIMNLVSLDTIKNENIKDNIQMFAIDSSNNIVVKNSLARSNKYISSDKSTNNNQRIKYFVTYKYLKEDKYGKCIVDNIPKINLRFMGILNSENETVSPKIKSYCLMVR